MGQRILDASLNGSPVNSPYSESRRKDSLFEDDEFREFVKEQMGEDWLKPENKEVEPTNVFGDTTKEAEKAEDTVEENDVVV